MAKAEKKGRELPRKPSPGTIRIMPKSIASLFVAASLGRLSHLFPRWMSVKIESEHNVTSSQLMVLFLLSQFKEMKMGQIAQMLDLTPRAITGLMVGLEKKKYISRSKDKVDHRITWIALSGDGKTFMKIARPDAASKLSNLFSVLSKQEQIDLVRIIEKLTDHMKAQIDEK
jgi:MarR family 2-MHQ and catechol resistance regulon transcriptional repressor